MLRCDGANAALVETNQHGDGIDTHAAAGADWNSILTGQ
jgi:hypothetical protein